jgi:hypothetical protein
MRDPNDPLYRPNVFNVTSEIEVLLGQIRMVLYTKPGELIGKLNFGIDLEQFVFGFSVTGTQLETIVREQIYQNCSLASRYDVKATVSFFYGTARDICLINIFIDGTKYLGILLK